MGKKGKTVYNICGLTEKIEDTEFVSEDEGISASVETVRSGISKGAKVLTLMIDDLCFEVQLSHGLNLGQARYKGRDIFWNQPNPLRCYSKKDLEEEMMREKVHKKTGEIIAGLGGWLDTFNGGLVLCGLNNCGSPGKDDVTEEYLTLHSTIGLLPSRKMRLDYDDNEFVFRGKIIQRVNGATYMLDRTIKTGRADHEIHVKDVVSNLGKYVEPLDALYHIQLGGAALEQGSVFTTPAVKLIPRDADAEKAGLEASRIMPAFKEGYFPENLWFHVFGAQDLIASLLRNPDSNLGVYTIHSQLELPQFSQWQQLGGWQFAQDEGADPAYNDSWYVNAPEPGFTRCPNRAVEREEGRLQYLAPGEERVAHIVIGAMDDRKEILALEKRIAQKQDLDHPFFYDK